MMRSLLEHVLSDFKVRRRLPASFGGGELIANAGAGGLKFLFRRSESLDPSLLAIARRFVAPGAVVWDVGANVGLFSVAAAALAGPRGQIFAFEADLDVARLLLETARLPANRCFAPISVLSLAVARNTGIASFAIASRARASNALAGFGASQMGGIAEVRLVPAMSLDDLRAALPAPTALKIDVEGAELLVLEGAQRVLKQDRPVVLCEVSHENNQAIATLLMNAGYRIFDGERQQATPAQGTTGMAPWNTIAIPAELAFAGFE